MVLWEIASRPSKLSHLVMFLNEFWINSNVKFSYNIFSFEKGDRLKYNILKKEILKLQ